MAGNFRGLAVQLELVIQPDDVVVIIMLVGVSQLVK